MMSSSIRLLLTGLQVDCTRNTSLPRTDSLIVRGNLAVGKGRYGAVAQRQPQLAADALGKRTVGIGTEYLDVLTMRNQYEITFSLVLFGLFLFCVFISWRHPPPGIRGLFFSFSLCRLAQSRLFCWRARAMASVRAARRRSRWTRRRGALPDARAR